MVMILLDLTVVKIFEYFVYLILCILMETYLFFDFVCMYYYCLPVNRLYGWIWEVLFRSH